MYKKSLPLRKALLDCHNQQELIMAYIRGESSALHCDLWELIKQFDVEWEILRSAILSYIESGGPPLEYKWERLPYIPSPEHLNQRGEEGWMLVHLGMDNLDSHIYECIFVRERKSQ